MQILSLQLLKHVKIIWKIKMKVILIVAVLNVQNVNRWKCAGLIVIVSVMLVEMVHVRVSIKCFYISYAICSLFSAPASCNDTIQNQDETDIDCGGHICPKCNDTKSCNQSSDCISNICSSNHVCSCKLLFIQIVTYCTYIYG